MKKALFILLGLLAGVPALFAQDALTFTRIDRNPLTSAFAGAGSASVGNTAWSALSNASVLPFYEGTLGAAVSYQNWAPGLWKAMHINAGVAYKVTPQFGVSLGYALQKESELDGFKPTDQIIALGLAYGFGGKWAVGVNGRYAVQQLTGSVVYSGFSGDAFVAFQPTDALRLTAGISTLGTAVSSASGKAYSQPASARLAADWILALGESHAVELVADGDYFFSGNYAAAAGLQYSWKDMVFLRGGYRYASEACVIPTHAALGAGFKFAGFRLDVSWLTASEALGNTICLGLAYGF